MTVLTYLEIIPTAEDTDTEEEINAVMNDVVEYQQWVSTDRAELLTTSGTILEVVDKTAKDLEKVIVHDFIARKQSQYLLNEKENMPVSKAIILMDFSMNYSTTIQDVVQAQHWKKEQASVHPAVVYYKNESNALCLQSLCYISDDLDHDVAFVLVTQRYVTNYIKEKFPWIKEVEYMTDGCAKQYKNKQVFLNLSRHREMFGLNASFSFFATSHGKSPCDGIGGTVKREATIASLQRPFDNQIIGAEKLFQFWKGRDSSIHFEFLSKYEISAARIEQKLYGLQPTTIPGTRSFHKFVPIAEFTIACKRFSLDDNYSLTHRLGYKRPEKLPYDAGSFVLVTIDGERYIALISDLNLVEDEADVTLLTPRPPSRKYTWPKETLSFVVPFPHILCTVNLKEQDNNWYKISKEDEDKVKLLLETPAN